ncbi:MAG: membrane protein insertase YidC [Gammaproteobacteria bacterium]|jgi:YidC/Oxa1 family membrane protein insertase
MNYIRYFLYGALLVAALLLWNAWQQEHQTVVTKSTTPAVQQPQQIPAAPTQQTQQTQQMRIPAQVASKKTPTINKSRIINVKTDVLDVDIDTLGGNIIKASLLKYPKELKSKEPFLLLNYNPDTLYTSQSGLLVSGQKTPQPLSYKTSQKSFVLAEGQKQLVVTLQAVNQEGIKITKSYIFKLNKYNVDFKIKAANNTNKIWNGSYYMQFTRTATPPTKKGTFSLRSFFGIAISSKDDPYQKFYFKKLDKKPIDQEIKGGWLAMVQHYFIGAWIPDSQTTYHYYSSVNNDGTYTAGIVSSMLAINPGKSVDINANFYAGPKIAKRLGVIAPFLAKTVDYGFLWFIAILLFKVMKFFYQIIGNWGWSIIAVTILIKLVFYKLSASSYKSMAGMRKLQPKLARLKEQYAGNKQALSKATMELYRKEKINPLGGCLPILIQIPVFFALYWVLLESVELRQAPFIFWIHDLSVKDPYYVLPILMGISMYIQQKLTPMSPDPTQAKMMMFLPVIMTVFFLNFPAGLVLYWLVNNVVSVAQQWYIMRKFEHGGYKHHHEKKPWWRKWFPPKGR